MTIAKNRDGRPHAGISKDKIDNHSGMFLFAFNQVDSCCCVTSITSSLINGHMLILKPCMGE